jgi:50S ribosomal subunit-associated GTPase HflX
MDDDRRVAADEATSLVPDEDLTVPDEYAIERPAMRPATAAGTGRAERLAEQRSGEGQALVPHVVLRQ